MLAAASAKEIILDQAIDGLFTANPAQRSAALRRIFVELLDFEGATGEIPLHHAELPSTAQRVARCDGLDVVLVQFGVAGRLTSKGLAEALKAARRTLSEVFLVAANNPGVEWQF